MKVKWKCIFYNVILPAIVAIIFVAIVGSWIIYESSKPMDPIEFNKSFQNMQQLQYQPSAFSMAPIAPVILISIMLALMLSVIRGMLKPCIIIENGVADHVAMGASVIAELISFMICIGFGLLGLMCVIINIMVMMSSNKSTYGPDPMSLTVIAIICFAISYFIYRVNQIDTVNEDDNK